MQTQIAQDQAKKPSSGVDWRAWGLVALAAVIWLALYNVIEPFANWIAYGLLTLPQNSHLGQSLAFFFYDVPKIILLLGGMIFLITGYMWWSALQSARVFMATYPKAR